MKLTGARVAIDGGNAALQDIAIVRGRIQRIENAAPNSRELDLSGFLLLPGLINAHDHLEFNLFPQLGRGHYPNASAWAADIYHPSDSPLKEHLAVPKEVRLWWGGLKNLLCGATTVAHHNPYEPTVFNRRFPVRVLRRYGWAHSLDFSPDLIDSYRRTPRNWPFLIHAGEGTDKLAQTEFKRLEDLGILGSRTVVVHGVGASAGDIEKLRDTNSSVVWCPSSNLFTLGRTLSANALRSGIPIALGSDSAITGQGDLIDELCFAHTRGGFSAEELYPMVTTAAAQILRLGNGEGTIREHGVADLIVVRDGGQTPAEAVVHLKPEAVIVGGVLRAISYAFAEQHPYLRRRNFHHLHQEGRGEWWVNADIPSLRAQATRSIGPEIHLAGKRVFA